MKNILTGIIFWTILILAMLAIFAIAEFLAKIITINFIMTIVYIAMGISIVYILKR